MGQTLIRLPEVCKRGRCLFVEGNYKPSSVILFVFVFFLFFNFIQSFSYPLFPKYVIFKNSQKKIIIRICSLHFAKIIIFNKIWFWTISHASAIYRWIFELFRLRQNKSNYLAPNTREGGGNPEKTLDDFGGLKRTNKISFDIQKPWRILNEI